MSRIVVALELALPESRRLVVLKPLKPVVALEPVLVLKSGLVGNHVEALRLVVALELVALRLVSLELAVVLEPVVAPELVVVSSPGTSWSPATQLNTPMNESSLYKFASCPSQAPALR